MIYGIEDTWINEIDQAGPNEEYGIDLNVLSGRIGAHAHEQAQIYEAYVASEWHLVGN